MRFLRFLFLDADEWRRPPPRIVVVILGTLITILVSRWWAGVR